MKSKWLDVVCLVPMHKIDSDQLRYWFNTVMKSLIDMFFILLFPSTIIAYMQQARMCVSVVMKSHYLVTSM